MRGVEGVRRGQKNLVPEAASYKFEKGKMFLFSEGKGAWRIRGTMVC